MKKLILICFFILVACDSPVRTRDPYGTPISTSATTSDDETNTQSDSNSSNGQSNSDNSSSDSSDSSTTDSTSTTETGFESCNLNYTQYIDQIGQLALCQSSAEEKKFRVKLANTDKSEGTCFVPVHINSDQSSYPLGTAQCVHQEGGKVYPMTLLKDRSENINGVMVLKANALNGYMQCMSAKSYYINSFSNCIYSQTCLNNANAYAAQVCSNFASVYSGYFKQISF